MMASNFFTTTQTGQTDELQTVFNNNGTENTDAEAFSQKKSEEFKTTREYEIYLQNEMKEALGNDCWSRGCKSCHLCRCD